MPQQRFGIQHQVTEFGFVSGRPIADPTRLEVDVVFTAPDGGEFRVPAYWAGDGEWRVRFAPPAPGL